MEVFIKNYSIPRKNKFQYFLRAIASLMFLLSAIGCEEPPETESFIYKNIGYKFYYESETNLYDIFPSNSFIKNDFLGAFNEAYIIFEIHRLDSFSLCNEYPPLEADLIDWIQESMSGVNEPFYLEGGLKPAEGYNWCSDSIPPDSLLGYFMETEGQQNPWHSASLVFVGRIRLEFNLLNDSEENDAITHVTIHEMGHQYGDLSDKYDEPSQHGDFCVMDELSIGYDGTVYEYLDFCDYCIDSLKKVDWPY